MIDENVITAARAAEAAAELNSICPDGEKINPAFDQSSEMFV